MLERIRRERGSGSDFLDLKTGTGGMIEAEFCVQDVQMRSGILEPNWQRALIALREIEMVSDRDASNATQSYEVLRCAERALRRFENKNISTLPSAREEQEKLAKRLGSFRRPGGGHQRSLPGLARAADAQRLDAAPGRRVLGHAGLSVEQRRLLVDRPATPDHLGKPFQLFGADSFVVCRCHLPGRDPGTSHLGFS